MHVFFLYIPRHTEVLTVENATHLIACHECDLVLRIPTVATGQSVRCRRCGALLIRKRKNSLDRTLAFSSAGLILFFLANAFPFLSFQMEAQIRRTTLITGIRELYTQDLQLLALLVLLTTVIVPFVQLAGMLYVLVPIRLNRNAPKLMETFRLIQRLKPWSMMEVFMLGILVSMVKLAQTAQIIPGIALYAFMALIFLMAAAIASLDPHTVWEKWRRHP